MMDNTLTVSAIAIRTTSTSIRMALRLSAGVKMPQIFLMAFSMLGAFAVELKSGSTIEVSGIWNFERIDGFKQTAQIPIQTASDVHLFQLVIFMQCFFRMTQRN